MERIIALDIGTVRIGVAASDPSGTLANGLRVLDATGGWMAELAEIVREYSASVVLVGMPRRTDGSEGPEAEKMRESIRKIARALPGVEVVEWDERFTTTIAQQALIEADVSRKGRKQRVDKVAATLLLQSYLDSKNKKNMTVPGTFMEALPPMPDNKKRKRKRDRAYD